MDPFGRNFLGDEEDAMDCCESEEERRQYSSEEDDIDEIEEALLQRIHYAEDYQEDSSPGEDDENRSPQQLMSDETFPHIKVTSVKRDEVELGNNFQIKVPVAGNIKNLDKTGVQSETSDVTVQLEVNKSSEKNRSATTETLVIKKLATAPQHAEENYVSAISIDSDSDQDSKYKSIPKSNLKSKISCDAQNSFIEISSDSRDEGGRLPRISSTWSKDEVEAISISSSDSDVEFISSKVLKIPQEEVASDEPPPSLAKRQWRKSAGASDDGSGALSQGMPAKKVKLKHSDVLELRQILDVIKEEVNDDDLSSEGDLSGAMVIESHSEDEALNVHFTNRGEGRYYQNEGNLYCYKCKRSGHKTYDCTSQKKTKVITCILCGTKGHTDRQCSERLCFICLEVGHQAKDCTNKKFRYMTCHRCSMKGHTAQYCPDRWRQYHLTTKPGNIIQYSGPKADQCVSVNGKVYCYNCSLEGHFGHECMEEPMDRYAPLILPYVVKYDFIPRRFWNIQMDHCPPLPDTMSEVNPQNEYEADSRIPHCDSWQGKEAKHKRKLTEGELQSIQSKKCRLKTNEEKERDNKLTYLLKKERQRIKKQHYKKSLEMEEVLDDYEKTNSYVQKGGHVLRKRDRLARRQYVVEEQPLARRQHVVDKQPLARKQYVGDEQPFARRQYVDDEQLFPRRQRVVDEQPLARRQYVVDERPKKIKQNNLPVRTKDKIEKRKEKKLRKKLKRKQEKANLRELKQQYEKQKNLDRKKQVTLPPSQELFEKELFGQEDHNFDSQKDFGHSNEMQLSKAQKRRQRRRQVSKADVYFKQFKRELPKDMGKPVLKPEEAASSTQLTQRQQKTQKKLLRQANDKLYQKRLLQAHQDQKEWKRQQRAVGQRFISDKGFRVQPRY